MSIGILVGRQVPFFLPWVGRNYGIRGFAGKRVLILAESHYGALSEFQRLHTQQVVRDWGQINRHSFFTKIQKLLMCIPSGRWIPSEQRVEFWNSVSFCNFIQSFAGDAPRRRPTGEMWSLASGPFLYTLEKLRPQVLLVLGRELQRHLPPLPSEIHKIFVAHPSSGRFRYNDAEASEQIRKIFGSVLGTENLCPCPQEVI